MQNIKNIILEKDMMYDNTVVLKYHIEYPCIISNACLCGIKRFNKYNQEIAFKLQERSENELYNEAVELYKYNKINGYPVMQYEIYLKYEITLNKEDIISMYLDEYIFSGGAHGNTVRSSQTWNLKCGKIIELADLYKNPYFLVDIFRSINEQIAREPEIYFDNTCNLVLDTFNPKSFFLDCNNIFIYFQQYDIAPYSSGIRVFPVNNETNNFEM